MNSPDQSNADQTIIDWQQALSAHRRWLLTVMLARGVEASAVEDVFQEVSATAIAGSAKLRDPAKLAPWLYRIAVTAALQYRRRVGRRKKLIRSYADRQEDSFTQEPDPLDWLLVREQQQIVRQAIEHLPPRDAEMLMLKYTEDWSYRELADHLGISASAVEARLHRARAKMRRALATVAPDQFSTPQ